MTVLEIRNQIDEDINGLSQFNGLLTIIKFIIKHPEMFSEVQALDSLSTHFEPLDSIQKRLFWKKSYQDVTFDLDESEFPKIINYTKLKIDNLIEEFHSKKKNFSDVNELTLELIDPIKQYLLDHSKEEQFSEIENLKGDNIMNYLFDFIERIFYEYREKISIEVDNWKKTNEKLVEDENIETCETNISIYPIKHLSYKYNILKELGTIDELVDRIGNSQPQIIGKILASILSVGEDQAKQLAKIHSQFGMNNSNDPIKSDPSKEFIKNFFDHYELKIRNLHKYL